MITESGYNVPFTIAPTFAALNSGIKVLSTWTAIFLGCSLSADFLINQQSLIKKLREPARSLQEQGERYWTSIVSYDEHFSRRIDLADAVARITPESLNNYYRTVFMDKNRRLWLTSDAIQGREKFFLVEDLLIHKQQMQSIVQP